MARKVKKAKFNEVNPDKVSRGHSFGKVGRSSTFKSKKDYKRKTRRNSKLEY